MTAATQPAYSKLIEGLRQFVERDLSLDDEVLVVALKRKGVTILRALLQSMELGPENLVSLEAVRDNPARANGKEILLFDDVVWKGEKLSESLIELSQIIERDVNDIRYATLFLNDFLTELPTKAIAEKYDWVDRDSLPTRVPLYFNKVTKNQLLIMTSHLIRYLMDQGIPLNVDHIIATLKIPDGSSFNDFIERLSRWGRVYRTYINPEQDVEFWGIDDPLFYTMKSCESAPTILYEGVVKLRFNRVGRNLNVIPMVFPGVIENKNHNKAECGFRACWPESNFCKSMFGGSLKGVDEHCFRCITFNLSLELAESAIHFISNEIGFDREELVINRSSLQCAFSTRDAIFWEKIEQKLRRAANPDWNARISLAGPVEYGYAEHLKPIRKTLEMDSAPFPALISSLIRDRCRGDSSWFTLRRREHEDVRKALSLTQINHITRRLFSHHHVSQSLDILFDHNVLRPETLRVYLHSKYGSSFAFTRGYTHSGEIVGDLLDSFYSMAFR